MKEMQIADEDWIVESRVLGGNYSSADTWIRSHNA